MAFPQVRSNAGSISSETASSHTVTLPATVNAGDLLLVIVCYDGNPTITWPGGWTAVPNVAGAGNGSACRTEARYKVADGTEDGTTITLTIGASSECRTAEAFAIHQYQGTPEAAGFSSAAASLTPDPPSVTASWGSADNLFIAVVGHDHGQRNHTGTPANYSNAVYRKNGNTGGTGLITARRELAAATDDPGTFTITTASEEYRSATIVIRGQVPATSVSPDPATAPLVVPTPSVTAGRRVSPSPAAATLDTPTPTARAGRRVSPDPVAVALDVPSATAQLGRRVSPSPIAAQLDVPTPDVTAPEPGTLTLTPDPVAVTLAVPTANAQTARRVTPDPVAASTESVAVVASAARRVSPSPVVLTLAAPVVSARAARIVSPDPVALTLELPAPGARLGRRVSPDPTSTTLAVATPAVTAPVTATPDPVVVTLALPAVELRVPVGVFPDPVPVVLTANPLWVPLDPYASARVRSPGARATATIAPETTSARLSSGSSSSSELDEGSTARARWVPS